MTRRDAALIVPAGAFADAPARVPGPLAQLIHEARKRRSLSLEGLATLLRATARNHRSCCEATRQTVHNWEAKGQLPHPETLRWLSIALEVPLGELVAAREAQMELTRRQLLRRAAVIGGAMLASGGRLPLLGGAGGGDRPGPPSTADPEVLAHLRQNFAHLDTADWLFGPRHVLPMVDGYLALIHQLLGTSTGSLRSELLGVGTRYAEFASWVNQDAGNLPVAGRWADLALEWAHEASDARMVSYVLMRKSSQAEALSDAGRTIGLATAAQQVQADLPARIRAVAAQQEAHGHALAGAELECQRKLDQALELATADVGDGPGRYCSPEFVEIQRASCWLILGQPGRAVALLEQELTRLPAVHRRDRGVYLARLAGAYAATDDVDAAALNARQALEIVGATGSRRIVAELSKLRPSLERWQDVAGVSELSTAVAALC